MTATDHPPHQRRSRRPAASGRPAKTKPTSRPYLVLIAYSSVPAARQAMARVTELLRGQRESLHLQPMLWRLDQLDDPRWREMALADAGRARALVLALGDTLSLGASGEAWLTALTVRQRGAKITALTFVGEDDAWSITLEQARADVSHSVASPPMSSHASAAPAIQVTPLPEMIPAACAA